MDRYAHVGLADTAAAVAKLPGLVKPTAEPGAATGAARGDIGSDSVRAGDGVRVADVSDERGAMESENPLKNQGVEGGCRAVTGTASAEGEGFEPSIPLLVYRFSRPTHSTTLPPLRVVRSNIVPAAAV
jgi:hypothetical protein